MTRLSVLSISSSSLGDKDRLYVDNVQVNIFDSSSSGGDDVLLGGAGDDSLTGGDGADVCTGGPGINTYDPSCDVQN